MLLESLERHDSMEHYREYGDYMAGYPYLYYCRRCIRNFSTKVRVKACNKCMGEDIVELPPGTVNVPLSRLKHGKEDKKKFSLAFLNKKIFSREPSEQNDKKEELKKEGKDKLKDFLQELKKKLNTKIKKADNEASEQEKALKSQLSLFNFYRKNRSDDSQTKNKSHASLFDFSRKPKEEMPSYYYEGDNKKDESKVVQEKK